MPSKLKQFFVGLIACLGSFCNGIGVGWSSASYNRILNGELGYEVEKNQIKWISGLYTIGGICMFFPAAILAKYSGPKCTMLISVAPSLLGFLFLIFGRHYLWAYAALFFIGTTSGGSFIANRLYLMHIAETSVRGMMGTLYQLMMTLGMTYVFINGAFVISLTNLNIASMIPSVVYFIGVLCIPESPVYHAYTGNYTRAAINLRRLRSKDSDVEAELAQIILDMERVKTKPPFHCSMLCSDKNINAFGAAFTLHMFHQLTGISCFTFYLSNILGSGNSPIDSKYVAILYAGVIIPFIFIAIVSVDKFGRRILLIVSGMAMTILGMVLGAYFIVLEEGADVSRYNWLPAITVILYNGAFHFGLGSLAFVVSLELFEEDLRYVALAICATINWVFRLITLLSFLPLQAIIGLGKIIAIFCIFNVLSIIFSASCLIETKGKTFKEIQVELE